MQKKKDEAVLVVKRDILFKGACVTGFKPLQNFSSYQKIINQHKDFLLRSDVEENTDYKQIIPYLIFCHQDKFFLMQRKSSASEQRLRNKYSLGIGGHVRREDVISDNIKDWILREFHEEIEYKGTLKIQPLGVINDDSNPVGQVHFGCVFLLEGSSETINIKSELKQGILATVKECLAYRNSMEKWSQLIFDYLRKNLEEKEYYEKR
jgi:predicted NUDIX family phosphoesterase